MPLLRKVIFVFTSTVFMAQHPSKINFLSKPNKLVVTLSLIHDHSTIQLHHNGSINFNTHSFNCWQNIKTNESENNFFTQKAGYYIMQDYNWLNCKMKMLTINAEDDIVIEEQYKNFCYEDKLDK